MQDHITQDLLKHRPSTIGLPGVRVSPAPAIPEELRDLHARLPEPFRGRIFPHGLPENRHERRATYARLRKVLPALRRAAELQAAQQQRPAVDGMARGMPATAMAAIAGVSTEEVLKTREQAPVYASPEAAQAAADGQPIGEWPRDFVALSPAPGEHP